MSQTNERPHGHEIMHCAVCANPTGGTVRVGREDHAVCADCKAAGYPQRPKAHTPQHTPGPWCVNGRAIEQDKARDASVIAYCEDEHTDEWAANARLIAVAPRMLTLLELVMDDDDTRETYLDEWQAILGQVKP